MASKDPRPAHDGRQHGAHQLIGYCRNDGCRHGAYQCVELSHDVEVLSLQHRAKCGKCGGKRVDVWQLKGATTERRPDRGYRGGCWGLRGMIAFNFAAAGV
jgi:hypothetical protein